MKQATIPVALVVLVPLVSGSADAGGIPWIGVNARYATYAMGDVNDDIRNLDALFYASFGEIHRGWGLGADAGVRIGPAVSVGAHYERLFAASKVSDYSGSIEYDLGAHALYASLDYRIPEPSEHAFGIGVGGGFVTSTGKISLSVAGEGSISGDTEGSGPLFQVHVFGELPVGKRAALVSKAGYRYAKVSALEIEGQPIYNADGSDYAVDYSGLFLSAGIRFLFGGE